MKKRLALLFAVIMLVGVLLVGCASTPTASTAPAESAAAAETSAAAETASAEPTAATSDAILRFGTSSLDGKFNPILYVDVYDGYVTDMMFDGLLMGKPDGSVGTDGIAESYTISDDKLTYTFKIRSTAKFTNGDPVTAEDVKYTYEMIASKDYDGTRGNFVANIAGAKEMQEGTATEISGIKVVDDSTVAITTVEPLATQLYDFTIGILSKKYYTSATYDEFKAKNAAPMGCGRFMFKAFTSGQSCELVANPDYYGKKAQIAGVTVLMIPDETQVSALQSGQVDLINPAAGKDNYDGMNNEGTSYVKQFPSNGYNMIGLNIQDPVLSDVKVRQALAYGLDVKTFVQTEWEGFASKCLVPIATVSWAYPDASDINPYDYNPETANKLLDEAGWKDTDGDGIRDKDGKKLSFTWVAYNDQAWPQHLVALATEQWKAIGVELKSELVDFNTMIDKVFTQQDFQAFNVGWSMSVDPDPTGGTYDPAQSAKGGNNPVHYSNDEANKLMAEGRKEFDQAKRAEIYKQWSKIVMDDLAYIPVASRDEIWGVSEKFTGFDNMGPFYNWIQCLGDVQAK